MKTNVNISNLKKVAASCFVTLVLTSGSFIQANPNTQVEMDAAARLDARMTATELEVRFAAPAVVEITGEMERLNALAATTEAAVRYCAPAAEPAPEMERLDILAGMTQAALQYVAPAVDEENFVTPELERLDTLVAATEASIRFTAPGADDNAACENNPGNVIMLADNN